jgi:hypothetical protein
MHSFVTTGNTLLNRFSSLEMGINSVRETSIANSLASIKKASDRQGLCNAACRESKVRIYEGVNKV